MGQLELLIGAALLTGLGLLAALYLLFRTVRLSSQCPRCGEPQPNRASRKGIMKRIPSRAYHCCGKRFYQLGRSKATRLQIREAIK